MTLDADILEHSAPAEPAADPRIAVAEMWLCMLGGLREIGKRFSRFLVHEIMPFGAGPKEPFLALRRFRDPVAAFKRLARTLRFAAVLCLKIEKQIAAWRAGAPFDLDAFIAQAPRLSARFKSGGEATDSEAEEWGDLESWEDLEDREDLYEFENLVERESPERFDVLTGSDRPTKEDKYQSLLRGPLKDAIAAICKELGLKPDWSLWTENGFPPPPDGQAEDWVAFFVPEAAATPSSDADGREPAMSPPRYDGHGYRHGASPSAWLPRGSPRTAATAQAYRLAASRRAQVVTASTPPGPSRTALLIIRRGCANPVQGQRKSSVGTV